MRSFETRACDFVCRSSDKARSLKIYYQYCSQFKVELNELMDDYFRLYKTSTLGLFCVSCRSIEMRTRVTEQLRLFLSLSTFFKNRLHKQFSFGLQLPRMCGGAFTCRVCYIGHGCVSQECNYKYINDV